ncbi:hypothetical protein M0812_05950 [Anaeramoeba flamelloides]|uniref:F-box domain-containing protein n=1 Tax=Anaeramoeba flamelloides TaxID=1746091 RepID=A0AAV8A648_9EUKA|nr:hypothetical protein M0812_05950 [Anaeramoeba flamelloides]
MSTNTHQQNLKQNFDKICDLSHRNLSLIEEINEIQEKIFDLEGYFEKNTQKKRLEQKKQKLVKEKGVFKTRLSKIIKQRRSFQNMGNEVFQYKENLLNRNSIYEKQGVFLDYKLPYDLQQKIFDMVQTEFNSIEEVMCARKVYEILYSQTKHKSEQYNQQFAMKIGIKGAIDRNVLSNLQEIKVLYSNRIFPLEKRQKMAKKALQECQNIEMFGQEISKEFKEKVLLFATLVTLDFWYLFAKHPNAEMSFDTDNNLFQESLIPILPQIFEYQQNLDIQDHKIILRYPEYLAIVRNCDLNF